MLSKLTLDLKSCIIPSWTWAWLTSPILCPDLKKCSRPCGSTMATSWARCMQAQAPWEELEDPRYNNFKNIYRTNWSKICSFFSSWLMVPDQLQEQFKIICLTIPSRRLLMCCFLEALSIATWLTGQECYYLPITSMVRKINFEKMLWILVD